MSQKDVKSYTTLTICSYNEQLFMNIDEITSLYTLLQYLKPKKTEHNTYITYKKV